jgi:putative transposase
MIRHECLGRMLIFSERQLIHVPAEYENHYSMHRPHRSMKQLPPIAEIDIGSDRTTACERSEILGSLINEYRRAA